MFAKKRVLSFLYGSVPSQFSERFTGVASLRAEGRSVNGTGKPLISTGWKRLRASRPRAIKPVYRAVQRVGS